MTDAVAALADFPQRLRMASWFSFVGTPLSDAERADISEYTESLGLGPLPVTELGDWRAAEDCIKQTDWDTGWWNAEEEHRQALLSRAEAKIGDMALTRALTELSEMVHCDSSSLERRPQSNPPPPVAEFRFMVHLSRRAEPSLRADTPPPTRIAVRYWRRRRPSPRSAKSTSKVPRMSCCTQTPCSLPKGSIAPKWIWKSTKNLLRTTDGSCFPTSCRRPAGRRNASVASCPVERRRCSASSHRVKGSQELPEGPLHLFK